MKNFKKIRVPALAILLSLLLALSGLTGCFRGSAGTASAFPHETSDLSPDPALRTGILENGFRYVLLENSRPRDRVNLHLLVSAGSFHEKEEERGLAHYLEHMMFNGTTNFPPGELVKYFQSIGMRFGNDVNASTGFLRTVYDLHLPSGDRDSLQQGLRVMDDYARGALLLESEVDKERDVILAEKRTRDSVSYRTYKAEMEFELPGSRFIRRYPIGTKEVIQAADSDLLRGYYDAWYRPENLILVMVGQFDPDTAGELVEKKFGPMEARAPSRPLPAYGQTRHTGTSVLYHYEQEAGGTEVSLETIVQQDPPPDTAEERKRRLSRDMAYRILNYRLDKLAEDPDPPFTNASAGAGRFLRQYRYASLYADCVPGKWAEALAALEKTLRTALLHGFTRAEAERARKEVLAELDRAVKRKDTRESGSLARGIMHHFFTDRVYLSPEQRQRLLAPVAESLTADGLRQALRQSWAPDSRMIMVTGNAHIETAPASPEDRVLSVYETSRAKEVTPPAEKAVPPFPYLPVPAGGEIVKRQAAEDIGVTRIDFENGTRLNFKKTDFKANQVRVKLGFGEGESAEPVDRPALCEMGAAVINQSGFGRMKKEQLRQALAGKKADISLSIADHRFYLSGACASDEVPLLFQLLHAFYNDFGCRAAARERVLASYAQQYDELKHTISGAMVLSGIRFFAGGDSRFGLPPDLADFDRITLAEIRDWMDRSLRRQAPEISVVGDFEPDELIEAVATYFGGMSPWEEGGSDRSPGEPAEERRPFFPEGESLELKVPTKISKALVDVAWATDDYWNIRRTRRLSVLSDIFSERMRQSIREEFGQTYSQYAYNRSSLAYADYGVFHAVAEVAPEDAGEVIRAIRKIAADIIENGVTEEELARAREPILTSIKERVKTNGYWLNSVLSGSRRHPEKLDWSRNFLTDYRSVTAEEVTRLARQYLDNAGSAVVTIRPRQGSSEPASAP